MKTPAIPPELWLLKATPVDATVDPWFYGLDGGARLIATSREAADRLALELSQHGLHNGIAKLEPVRVK